MPCSIRSPQVLRALRRRPAPASRANVSQRCIPWAKSGHSTSVQAVHPQLPRFFLSMDKRLSLGSGHRKHQFSPADVGDAWSVLELRAEIWGVHVLGPILISYRDPLHTNQRFLWSRAKQPIKNTRSLTCVPSSAHVPVEDLDFKRII
jgi:hypothetical protein